MSVEGFHDRFIRVVLTALPDKRVGTVGTVVSRTVTVKVALPLLAAVSVAVQVTVVVPSG